MKPSHLFLLTAVITALAAAILFGGEASARPVAQSVAVHADAALGIASAAIGDSRRGDRDSFHRGDRDSFHRGDRDSAHRGPIIIRVPFVSVHPIFEYRHYRYYWCAVHHCFHRTPVLIISVP